MRSRVGSNRVGLFVLAGEAATARRRVLDPAIYREALARLDRFFTVTIVDCGSTMDSAVTQEALADLDALIVVSSPWLDGASAAGQTLEWLGNSGYTGLLHRTVLVINDSDGHADERTRKLLVEQFATRGQTVVEVPFDAPAAPGRGGRHRQRGRAARRGGGSSRSPRPVAEHFAATTDRSGGAAVTAPGALAATAAPARRRAPAVPASCRVSILVGADHQMDMVLPAAVPLEVLIDPTREAINRRLRASGDDELGRDAYVFARAAGMTAAGRDRCRWPPRGCIDAGSAGADPGRSTRCVTPPISRTCPRRWRSGPAQHFPSVTRRDAAVVAALLAVVALAVSAAVLWRLRWSGGGGWIVAAVLGGLAVALGVAAWVSSRLRAEPAVVGLVAGARGAGGDRGRRVRPAGRPSGGAARLPGGDRGHRRPPRGWPN